MSSFVKKTKHPITEKFVNARWVDDYFGRHMYGVIFEGETIAYDPLITPLYTQDDLVEESHVDYVYMTKDSGKRVSFDSGFTRDVDDDKPRYDLIPTQLLKRLAELYARGCKKYGENNWRQAETPQELNRFKASAFRHFMQWMNGEEDEDHGIATVWNIFAYEWHTKHKHAKK